mgnify:CR=1 FL=1
MHTFVLLLLGLVAFEQLYFLYLEMFAWTKPRTLRASGTTADFAEACQSLAPNPGLCTGFPPADPARS